MEKHKKIFKKRKWTLKNEGFRLYYNTKTADRLPFFRITRLRLVFDSVKKSTQ